MIKLNKTNFDDTIKSSNPILVKFGAIWCGPCRSVTQTLKELETPEFPIYEVDIDECLDICERYKIQSVPTLIIFKEGNIIKSHTGFMDKNGIQEFIKNI